MAFLNDLDRKLTMLGQGAIQKTKEVTDSAKLSSTIRNMEIQKKDVFGELGAVYYKEHRQNKEGVSQAAADIISKIEELEQQIRAQKEEMQKIKGTTFCPNCNNEIPDNSAFCNVCGAKIENQSVNNIPSKISGMTCKKCGASLNEDQEFCIMCGSPVNKQKSNDEMQLNKRIICPNCGKEVPDGMKFCTSCGTKVE